jgi:hypothetical protein
MSPTINIPEIIPISGKENPVIKITRIKELIKKINKLPIATSQSSPLPAGGIVGIAGIVEKYEVRPSIALIPTATIYSIKNIDIIIFAFIIRYHHA